MYFVEKNWAKQQQQQNRRVDLYKLEIFNFFFYENIFKKKESQN